MKIYVDADACPMVEETTEEAGHYSVPVILVKSFAHYSSAFTEQPGVETIYVDTGADAVDYRIVQLATKGDIVITQDYGLASLLLAKKCIVLHHSGFVFREETIDSFLTSRYVSAKARKAGQKTKGPKALTAQDRAAFRCCLVSLLVDCLFRT